MLDAKTMGVFRGERLKKLELVDKLFTEVLRQIDAAGFTAHKGELVDGAIVPASERRNSGDENAQIKEGETAESWRDAKAAQKDVDARWTKKQRSCWMRTIAAEMSEQMRPIATQQGKRSYQRRTIEVIYTGREPENDRLMSGKKLPIERDRRCGHG